MHIIGLLLLGATITGSGTVWPCRVPARPPAGESLVMNLRVELRVVDVDQEPIRNAKVSFLDASVGEPEKRHLGQTDEDGYLATDVYHQWDDYFKDDRRSDAGAFRLLVEAPNGESRVRHFVAECIPRRGEGFLARAEVRLFWKRDTFVTY